MIYYPQEDSFNLNFQLLEYNTIYAVPNLGTIFFILVIILLLIPISIALVFFARSLKELRKHSQNLKEFLYWKGTIRFFTESYMEILLAVSLNVHMIDNELDYVGVKFSNSFAILFFILAAGLPIWIIIFFWINYSKWDDKEFLKKYSPVLEGTRKSYIEFE